MIPHTLVLNAFNGLKTKKKNNGLKKKKIEFAKIS